MAHNRKTPSNEKGLKRVTLQDIADVAGVQKMAVSNALNGTRSVAPATRERIQRIADELNYIPNFAARALTQGRTGIIAVLSGPVNEFYYSTMVHLLEQRLRHDGFHLMLMHTPGEVRDLVQSTGDLAVDGAIAVDMLGLVNEFRSHPTMPCVSISTAEQSLVDNVFVDLSASIAEAMKLIFSQGRRRVAYLVTADIMTSNSEVRARTYRSQMQQAGYAPEFINVVTNDLDRLEQRFKTYLEKHGCPDALLCQNDETAICAAAVLKEMGHTIPHDVLLMGCDGQRHMNYLAPPLSTIVQPMEEICDVAWDFLQRRIKEPTLARQEATLCGTLRLTKSLGELSDAQPTPRF